MSVVLDKAIDAYERHWLLERANAAYATLRSDPGKWHEESAERREWEGKLGDGENRRRAGPA